MLQKADPVQVVYFVLILIYFINYVSDKLNKEIFASQHFD